MAIAKSDIKFYLTSLEPDIEQTIKSQSIGGYPATVDDDATKSLVYPETTLSSSASKYDTSLNLTSYGDLAGLSYVGSNFEIIKVDSISSNTVQVSERSVGSFQNVHISGDVVYGLSLIGLFSDVFNENRKQYRCIALKNTNTIDTAYNVKIYLRQKSINAGSTLKFSVEMPTNDFKLSTATDGSETTVVDSSLVGLFVNNHFVDSRLKITSGLNNNQARTILSFDSVSGTIVLSSSLPYEVIDGTTYQIEPTPAQRLSSGTIQPTTGSLISLFSSTAFRNINVSGERDHEDDLQPNDIIYIWLERELIKGYDAFTANNAILTMNYSTSI